MRRRTPLVLGLALSVAMTLGLAAPLSGAPPELRIQDMDAARAHFSDSSEGWELYVDVSYVYADSVRYHDGSVTRPHTDVDIWLWACTDGDCVLLRGTENMGDKPASNGALASMEGARLSGVFVELCVGSWEPGCSVVGSVWIEQLDWTAVGPERNLRVIEPAAQTLVGKERDAIAAGTVRILSAPDELGAFVGDYSNFDHGVIQNYNEVFRGY